MPATPLPKSRKDLTAQPHCEAKLGLREISSGGVLSGTKSPRENRKTPPASPGSVAPHTRQIASYKTGWSPATETSLASPCRTGDIEPGGSPPPGRCASPRTTGPESAGPCGRRNSGARSHIHRTPFFLPADQPNNPSLRIAESPLERGPWTQPGEAVGVQQALPL